MSVFGPNQVGELIIGEAIASEANVSDFISGASDKEIQVVSKDGGAATVNKPFYILQKASKASGSYEFSDSIDPKNIESVSLGKYSPEVAKKVTVSGFEGTVKPNSTYEVMIRLYNDGGSLSVENFRVIPGYFVTNGDGTSYSEVIEGVVDSLNKSQKLEGSGNFIFTANSNNIVVEAVIKAGNPATDIAKPVEFDVQAVVKSNTVDAVTGLPEIYSVLTVTETVKANPGVGTGKYIANYEWFTKGSKYEVYRDVSYPAGFNTPYYADYNGAYNVVSISYFSQRNSTNVERQYKALSIAVKVDPEDVATNSVVNGILAKLRTVAPNATIPADLAVS